MSDETTLLPCPFCGGEAHVVSDYSSEHDEMRWSLWHECCEYDGEGGYGRALFPWFETPWYKTEAEAIAAWNTRAYLNHDGLPMGLTISDDDNLLNWRGENYVKQGTLGNGTLTAEQVREAVEASTWAETSTIREFNDSSWQAIADELSAELGSECDKWKAKAEEAGRAMNAAAGLWAKADEENRELRKMLLLDDGTVEEYTERADPLTALAYQKQLAEEWRDRCHNAEALCDKIEAERDELNAKLGSGTCEMVLMWSDYEDGECYKCSKCGDFAFTLGGEPRFCPECSAKVVGK